jgi:hypothetical protein
MPAFNSAVEEPQDDPIHPASGVVLTHELLNSTAKVEASVTNGAISDSNGTWNQAVIRPMPAAWGNRVGRRWTPARSSAC